ncbi:hypothetical protein NDU88_001815 [Pleurodeles waltl]|uniref:Uncharacterized protein n=1 Tax=Pleurodeles waltl TaxID=8319 RepID=A0AAV7T1D5_PLEWA|nr:hypothetical protein NDU88_001815 [Pleurodeles waltl]
MSTDRPQQGPDSDISANGACSQAVLPRVARAPVHLMASVLSLLSDLTDPAMAAAWWKTWLSRLMNYFHAIREMDPVVKRPLLYQYAKVEAFTYLKNI